MRVYKLMIVVHTGLACVLSVALMLSIPRPYGTAENLMLGFLTLTATVSCWLCANFIQMSPSSFRLLK